MSRNLGQSNCYFCRGRVKCTESPRTITSEDCGVYFQEYRGMVVANAECEDCEARYLAWLDGSLREGTGVFMRDWCNHPRASTVDGELEIGDLSFRSTFNDEPGEDDMPRWRIVVERRREPLKS